MYPSSVIEASQSPAPTSLNVPTRRRVTASNSSPIHEVVRSKLRKAHLSYSHLYSRIAVFAILSVPFLFFVFENPGAENYEKMSGSVSDQVDSEVENVPHSPEFPHSPFAKHYDDPTFDWTSTTPDEIRTEGLSSSRQSTKPGKKISIISACFEYGGGPSYFDAILSSWVRDHAVHEVVIVDWGSSSSSGSNWPSIIAAKYNVFEFENTVADGGTAENSAGAEGPRPVLIAVSPSQSSATVTRAYNLAARVASGDWLFKVGCSTTIDRSFFQNIGSRLATGDVFFTNSDHVNIENAFYLDHLSFLVKRDAFLSVGGIDERTSNPGEDKTELFSRLRDSAALKQKFFNISWLYHLSEDSGAPNLDAVIMSALPQMWRQINMIAVPKVDPWTSTGTSELGTLYSLEYSKKAGFYRARVERNATRIVECLPPQDRAGVVRLASERALHDNLNVPWDVIQMLDTPETSSLLRFLAPPKRRILFVDVKGLLVDRLFTIAWALSVAIQEERALMLIWDDDSWVDELEFARNSNTMQGKNFSIDSILDVKGTNAAVENLTRIFTATNWQCQLPLTECLKWDFAYSHVDEYHLTGAEQFFTLKPHTHALVRLTFPLKGALNWPGSAIAGQSKKLAVHALRFASPITDGLQALMKKAPEAGIVTTYVSFNDHENWIKYEMKKARFMKQKSKHFLQFYTGPQPQFLEPFRSEEEPLELYGKACAEDPLSLKCLHEELIELLYTVNSPLFFPTEKSRKLMKMPGVEQIFYLRKFRPILGKEIEERSYDR